ncbi:hypothetical protein ACSBR1_032993 [Camellia fascicularis]
MALSAETGTGKLNSEQIIEIYKNGLDDLFNVNSLFSIAVFLGLSFATPGQRCLESRPNLVAKSLKVNLQIYGQDNFYPKGGLRFLKWLFLCLSVLGLFFLDAFDDLSDSDKLWLLYINNLPILLKRRELEQTLQVKRLQQ